MISFSDFYFAVHRRRPFRWQERLSERVAAEGWPEVIGPPTASGKTSVIDIAVWALAGQADRPALERWAPLRTFFVVDRRLVVDDVTRHAEEVRDRLNDAPELDEVRYRLLSFGGDVPLEVATLRGGMYRNDSWADRPNQPLVCVSTVDQVGSRLLFRGYGVGDRRRPVDAGLVGCDSLIVLDEAHLSQPFLETVRSVQRYMGWNDAVLPALRMVEMSATALHQDFVLEPEDYDDAIIADRLNAPKPAKLREVADLEKEAADEARRLAAIPGRAVIGIVLNTVGAARSVFERLYESKLRNAILLTGRVRPYDRDRILQDYRERMMAGRTRQPEDRLFVVATQTIEVGADLDFDGLVTEAASLDSLRQRFGRLNRLGQLNEVEAVVLKKKGKKGQLDPVYKEAAEHTWNWLNDSAVGGVVDFGARRMLKMYEEYGNSLLNSASVHAPILFPAHLESWIQTSCTPAPDPEVAPFLHGPEAGNADVNIVWRGDLEGESIDDWADIVSIAPPTVREALALPIWTARKWLSHSDPGVTADIEGLADQTEDQSKEHRSFLIWRGPEDSPRGEVGEMRPGDTIVVRSAEGGCDEFGWNPSSGEVVDIGDECAKERVDAAGGRYRVRVHPSLSGFGTADELRRDLEAIAELEDDDAAVRIGAFVENKIGRKVTWLRPQPYGNHRALCYQSRWIKKESPKISLDLGNAEETSEDDTASLRGLVTLTDHTAGVQELTRKFAAGCGLPAALCDALATAAELHDIGKADARFQILLSIEGAGELLAKGKAANSPPEYERRRARAGYPKGARHEFWSVAMASSGPAIGDPAFWDLVLYLVGTHHGHGRPFAPVWDERGCEVRTEVGGRAFSATSAKVAALAQLGSGWVDRFWTLNRKYGYWGLAYLEAILRRADCVRSRWEEENQCA